MTTAQNKKEFIENWEGYVWRFTSLGQSAEKAHTWEEIKRLKKEMNQLVLKVADECYGEDEDESV